MPFGRRERFFSTKRSFLLKEKPSLNGRKSWSRWRDLNPRPLPYQGSALPLSYIGKMHWSGRRGSNSRPSAWKADALSTELLPHLVCGRRWIRTTEGINQQIYSLPHLATLVFALTETDRLASLGRLRGSFLISECKVKHFFVTHQMFSCEKFGIFPPNLQRIAISP